jgi:hypothetical protein
MIAVADTSPINYLIQPGGAGAAVAPVLRAPPAGRIAGPPDEGHDDIAGFQGGYARCGLEDFTHAFVADDEKAAGWGRERETKRSQISIGTADTDLTDPEEDLAVAFEPGFGTVHLP